MIEYITVAEVDAALPSGWEGAGDKDIAVLQANTYLNRLTFKAWDAQPDAITRAGVELAREAANNRLFVDSEGVITRKKVKADTVESEKEYQEGIAPRSGALQFVDALIEPYLAKRSATQILRRL